MPRAFITGITGQVGSTLAELLLDKGYEVHGLMRRASTFTTGRVDSIIDRLTLHYGDMTDSGSLRRVLTKAEPDEVYNLAAQSHVMVSFVQPEYTNAVNALGALHLFEAVRDTKRSIRVFQASSSEMFGSSPPPQNEMTPFHPRSPYGVSKLAAYWHAVSYREAYRMPIVNGLTFNTESARRGETFVTRKITRALARIRLGLQKDLILGNLDARRDWVHVSDTVDAIWRMTSTAPQSTSITDDFVVATGESHTVREFLDEVGRLIDIDWQAHVRMDPKYLRPTEVDALEGDASKARKILGWTPKVGFKDLVKRMVEHDMQLARQELVLERTGGAVRG